MDQVVEGDFYRPVHAGTLAPAAAGAYMVAMEQQIMRLFRRWARENLPKNTRPGGQDAAQFFTDHIVADRLPAGADWPTVHKLLVARALID